MIVLEIFAEQQVDVFWKSFNRIDYVSSSCLEKTYADHWTLSLAEWCHMMT